MADRIPSELARRIELVVLDVDGVLTDNGVFIGQSADEKVELKRFNIMDGLGIRMLSWAGLRVVLVSGRASAATTIRAGELDVECFQEGSRKSPVVRRLLSEMNIDWAQMAAVADDLADLPVLQRAGLPVRWPTRRPRCGRRPRG
ncbi:MAG TPA: hypothetical protein VK966_13240 [Longimicrobiales bacterium]|nr:hypothetical protein [Longimicrobiales bacterium]